MAIFCILYKFTSLLYMFFLTTRGPFERFYTVVKKESGLEPFEPLFLFSDQYEFETNTRK